MVWKKCFESLKMCANAFSTPKLSLFRLTKLKSGKKSVYCEVQVQETRQIKCNMYIYSHVKTEDFW